MKKIIAMFTLVAASLFGTFGVLPEWASPAEAHTSSTILAICDYINAAEFGPGVFVIQWRSVHYGDHWANCCFSNLVGNQAQMYYDINTGLELWNVHYSGDGFCPGS